MKIALKILHCRLAQFGSKHLIINSILQELSIFQIEGNVIDTGFCNDHHEDDGWDVLDLAPLEDHEEQKKFH